MQCEHYLEFQEKNGTWDCTFFLVKKNRDVRVMHNDNKKSREPELENLERGPNEIFTYFLYLIFYLYIFLLYVVCTPCGRTNSITEFNIIISALSAVSISSVLSFKVLY